MRKLFHFIGTLFIIAVQAFILSAVLWLIQWIISLTGLCGTPEPIKLLYGAIGLFILLFVYSTGRTLLYLYRFHKYPQYKDMYEKAGVKWDDFKEYINNLPPQE